MQLWTSAGWSEGRLCQMLTRERQCVKSTYFADVLYGWTLSCCLTDLHFQNYSRYASGLRKNSSKGQLEQVSALHPACKKICPVRPVSKHYREHMHWCQPRKIIEGVNFILSLPTNSRCTLDIDFPTRQYPR